MAHNLDVRVILSADFKFLIIDLVKAPFDHKRKVARMKESYYSDRNLDSGVVWPEESEFRILDLMTPPVKIWFFFALFGKDR